MDREWGAQDALALRAPHRLRPVARWPSTRRCEGGAMSGEVGFTDDGPRARAARSRTIGVGMLGYAFMGKAHSNAYRTLAYMAWPPPLVPAARRDRGPRRGGGRRGGDAATASSAHVDRLARPRRRPGGRPLRQRRAERPPRGADDRRGRGGQARRLREAARPRRGESVRDLAARRRGRASCTCARSTTASCPPCGSRGELIEAGELGEIHHFRGRYLQEWGATDAGGVALRAGARGLRRARRPRRARGRPRALPRRRDRRRSPPRRPTFQPGREVDDAFEAAVRVRERRDRHDRGDPLRHRAQERVHAGRSTARRGRSRSTSSG